MLVSRIHYGHILGVAAILAPTLGLFAPLMVAPLAVITIFAATVTDLLRRSETPQIDWLFLAPFLLLFIWTAITLTWSADGDGAVRKWAALATVGIPFVYVLLRTYRLFEEERRILRSAVCVGAALGLGLAMVEVATKGFIMIELFGFKPPSGSYIVLVNRAPAVLLLFAWLAAAASPKGGWIFIMTGAVMAYALPSESALVAYGAAIFVYWGVLVAPKLLRVLLPATMAATLLIGPSLFATIDKPVREFLGDGNSSIAHRLEIWQFTNKHIQANPLTGLGFNGSRQAPGGGERYVLRNKRGQVIGNGDRLPLHPHNGAMQIWLELGLPGALLVAMLAALTGYRAITLRERHDAAMAAGLVTTAFLIWLLSFGVWQSWWMSTFVLAFLLAVPSRRFTQGGNSERATS